MSTASDIVGTVVSSATPWGQIIGLVGGVGTGIAANHYAPPLRAAGKRWLGRKLFQNISS